MAGSNSNNALGLFIIKDSLRGRRRVIETGVVAAAELSISASESVWQHLWCYRKATFSLPHAPSLRKPCFWPSVASLVCFVICVAKQTSGLMDTDFRKPKSSAVTVHVNKQTLLYSPLLSKHGQSAITSE